MEECNHRNGGTNIKSLVFQLVTVPLIVKSKNKQLLGSYLRLWVAIFFFFLFSVLTTYTCWRIKKKHIAHWTWFLNVVKFSINMYTYNNVIRKEECKLFCQLTQKFTLHLQTILITTTKEKGWIIKMEINFTVIHSNLLPYPFIATYTHILFADIMLQITHEITIQYYFMVFV